MLFQANGVYAKGDSGVNVVFSDVAVCVPKPNERGGSGKEPDRQNENFKGDSGNLRSQTREKVENFKICGNGVFEEA